MNDNRNPTLAERWLLLADVPPAELNERNRKATGRARRYPFPINVAYPLILWFLNWFGPLLTLFSFSRASRLSEAQFERFIVALKKHPNSNIRGLEMLAFFPLKEVLVDGKSTDTDFVHPLETVREE